MARIWSDEARLATDARGRARGARRVGRDRGRPRGRGRADPGRRAAAVARRGSPSSSARRTTTSRRSSTRSRRRSARTGAGSTSASRRRTSSTPRSRSPSRRRGRSCSTGSTGRFAPSSPARRSIARRSAWGARTVSMRSRRRSGSSSPAGRSPSSATGCGSSARSTGLRVGKLSGAVGPVRRDRPGGRADRLRAARARAGAELDADPAARPPRRAARRARRSSASSLDRFATEIRHLARTEVREVEEPFGRRPEGLVGDAAQAQPDHRRADLRARARRAGERARRARERRALARARHLALVRRADRAARLVPRDRLRARPVRVARRGARRAPGAHAGERRRRATGSSSASDSCSRSSRAGSRGTTPTGSSSGTRCARGTRSSTSASSSGPTPRSRDASTSTRCSTSTRTPRTSTPSSTGSGRSSPRARARPCLRRRTSASGKVRELYALGRRPAAARRLGPHLDVRRRAPDGDPRQGARPHRPLRVLVRPHASTSSRTTSSRFVPTAARSSADGSRCCPSRSSCAGTSPARAGSTTGTRVRSAAIDLPAGLRRVRAAARADRHARRRRRRRGTTSTSPRPRRRRSAATSAYRRRTRRRARALRVRGGARRGSGGILLADTKFELGLDADGRRHARRRGADARLVALLAGRRATRPAARSRRSTSSTCATGASRPAGTAPPPGPELPDDVVAGTRARYVEAFERLTEIPFDALPRRPEGRAVRLTVLIRPKAGILDPQGEAVQASLATLGFSVAERARRPAGRRSSVDDGRPGDAARAEVERMCAELLANPLIESFEIARRRTHERPARPRDRRRHVPRLERRRRRAARARAARRRGGPPSGTRDASCRAGRGGVVLPGGFSYGDYLRCGAIARVAPVMDAVRRVRRRRRAGARHLQRLPDPLRGGAAAGRAPPEPAARVPLRGRRPSRSSRPRRRSPSAARPAHELVIPVKHGEGNWVADDELFAEVVDRGQIVLRYVEDVNGARDRVAGVANEDGNVLGLMPHPEHAVDPLLGPTGGVPLLEGLIAAARERRRGRDRLSPQRPRLVVIPTSLEQLGRAPGVRPSATRSFARSRSRSVTGPRRAVPSVAYENRTSRSPLSPRQQLDPRREPPLPRRAAAPRPPRCSSPCPMVSSPSP